MAYNYYWVESPTRIAKLMVKTSRVLAVGKVNKGVFYSANCGHLYNNPMVLGKATEEEVAKYLKKPYVRELIITENSNRQKNVYMHEEKKTEKDRAQYSPRRNGILQNHLQGDSSFWE